MRLEVWLTELIATAALGLRLLQAADSDEAYRAAAELVETQMQPYVADQCIAVCELDRRPVD